MSDDYDEDFSDNSFTQQNRLQSSKRRGNKPSVEIIPKGNRKSKTEAATYAFFSLQEDLEILKYARCRINSKDSITPEFWKTAIEEDNLLGNRRAARAIYDRYHAHLRHLTRADLEYINAWVKKNGVLGVLRVSGTKNAKSEGKNSKVIRLYKTQGTRKKPDFSETKTEESRSRQTRENNARGVKHELYIHDDTTAKSNLYEVEIDHIEPDKRSTSESGDEKDFKKNSTRSVGRRTSGNLGGTKEEEQIQRKYIKQENDNNGGGSRLLNQVRNDGRSLRDQLKDLLFCCSMDFTNLARYLGGDSEVLWHEDEDQVLMQQPNNPAIRSVFSRYKGERNVEQRIEFLGEFEKALKVFKEHSNIE